MPKSRSLAELVSVECPSVLAMALPATHSGGRLAALAASLPPPPPAMRACKGGIRHITLSPSLKSWGRGDGGTCWKALPTRAGSGGGGGDSWGFSSVPSNASYLRDRRSVSKTGKRCHLQSENDRAKSTLKVSENVVHQHLLLNALRNSNEENRGIC